MYGCFAGLKLTLITRLIRAGGPKKAAIFIIRARLSDRYAQIAIVNRLQLLKYNGEVMKSSSVLFSSTFHLFVPPIRRR